eukprot:366313-Chlamydomonas_euryale.AAC.4
MTECAHCKVTSLSWSRTHHCAVAIKSKCLAPVLDAARVCADDLPNGRTALLLSLAVARQAMGLPAPEVCVGRRRGGATIGLLAPGEVCVGATIGLPAPGEVCVGRVRGGGGAIGTAALEGGGQ